MLRDLHICIAGMTTRAWTRQEHISLHCPSPEDRFVVDAQPPDLSFEVSVGPLPETSSSPLIFRGRQIWSLVQDGEALCFRYGNERSGIAFDRVLRMLPDGTGTLTVLPAEGSTAEDPQMVNPFEFPGLELLLYREAAVRGGGFFHGSGLVFEGRGCLFCGLSGSGKSTLTGLLHAAGADVLNDDRVGLFPDCQTARMHGTPWHGTAEYHRPDKSPLHAAFFIEHGTSNRLEELSRLEASARLMAASCPPYYSRELTERAVAACEDVAARVRCYRLAFLPDSSVVEVVRGALVAL